MKLLLDQNLSPRLVSRLADLLPGSTHVQDQSLDHAADSMVWEFARDQDYVIVTKDVKFTEQALLKGVSQRLSGSAVVTVQRRI